MNDSGSCNYICSIISNEIKFFNWVIHAMADSPASRILESSQILYTKLFSLDEINDILKKKKTRHCIVWNGMAKF